MKKLTTLGLYVLLCIIIMSTSVSAASSTKDTASAEICAGNLKNLGLFQGVSETNLALDRQPTRVEAIIMLLRLLGKESTALNSENSHPFKDTPSWADKYIGYAYAEGLTQGVSNDRFGAGAASASMYLTYVLRALGYADAEGKDFTWDNPFALAREVGILTDAVNINRFLRADVVLVSYAALMANIKDTSRTLAQKLIDEGVFTKDDFNKYYKGSSNTAVSDEAIKVVYVSAVKKGNSFYEIAGIPTRITVFLSDKGNVYGVSNIVHTIFLIGVMEWDVNISESSNPALKGTISLEDAILSWQNNDETSVQTINYWGGISYHVEYATDYDGIHPVYTNYETVVFANGYKIYIEGERNNTAYSIKPIDLLVNISGQNCIDYYKLSEELGLIRPYVYYDESLKCHVLDLDI